MLSTSVLAKISTGNRGGLQVALLFAIWCHLQQKARTSLIEYANDTQKPQQNLFPIFRDLYG